MTLEWKPTTGHTYKVYEIVNGTRKLLGTTATGNFTPPNISKGDHHYVVTVVNKVGESRASNDISFRMKGHGR